MTCRNWYAELEPESDEHPVSKTIHDRLRGSEDHGHLWRRILELGGQLGERLDEQATHIWFELEELLTERSWLVAVEHYNAGVEAGLQMRVVDDVLSDAGVNPKMRPTTAMRALATALAQIADHLDGVE